MLASIVNQNIWFIYTFIAFLLSVLFGLFLFWRQGKRELVEDQILFDSFIFFLLGSLLGRLVDFFIRVEYYQWSLVKLLFINVYHGFDFFGAFFGGLIAVYFYLRVKKQNFWFVLDHAVGGVAFAMFFYKTTQFFLEKFLLKMAEVSLLKLYVAFGYFLIFWAIKRFEKKKKHKGYFASFFLVSFSALNLIVLFYSKNLSKINYFYILILMSSVMVISAINWYILSKRKINSDLKNIFAAFILLVFKLKRLFTNVREADNTARVIVLAPLYVANWLYFLVKYVSREIYVSIKDMLAAFGLSK